MSYYRQLAIDNIEKAVASANASSSIQHSLQKGRLREIVVSELVQPFLTPHTKAATGTIIDHYGNQSNPIDIILYDERITPPVLLTATEGIVPCHSVLATIEVKTRMNRTELAKAVENAKGIFTLDLARIRTQGARNDPFGDKSVEAFLLFKDRPPRRFEKIHKKKLSEFLIREAESFGLGKN